MKRILIAIVTTVFLFSVFTVFSKPNPNSTSTLNKLQNQVDLLSDRHGHTPEIVKARLEALDCEIEMAYNSTVQTYIDQFFKSRKSMEELLERSSYYMPIFEQALKDAGLPDELKYIPVVESRLKPKVTSNRGAGGLWQFMPGTAKGYDMVINSSIDERCDPYISSERACRLLKKQYERFGDWGLALAAYNAGSGTVQRAIRRAGGDSKSHNFWSIYKYLPSQTQKYVPKFVAMTYIMTYYPKLNANTLNIKEPIATDTIHVTTKSNLSKIAGTLDIPVAQLRELNPHLRADVIPASAARHCNLILPAGKKHLL